MKAKKAVEALESLKQGDSKGIDRDHSELLKYRGLVSILTSSQHHVLEQDASRLDPVRQRVSEYEAQVNDYQATRDRLTKKLGSRLHRGFSFQSTLDREQAELSQAEIGLQAANQGLSDSQNERDRLEKLKIEIQPYVFVSGEYVAPTELGQKRLRQLSVRMPRIEDSELDPVLDEITNVEAAINTRYERFKQFYEGLIKKGFRHDPRVGQFALSLSGIEGDFETTFQQIEKIDSELEAKLNDRYGYTKDYDRLKILAALAINKDAANFDELAELYGLAIENGHTNSWATLFEQVLCLRIPQKDAQAKWQRYDGLQDELDKRQWAKNKAATCYIAANLARREGDLASIAEEFRGLEKKLIETGRSDCVKSGIAALVLLAGKEDLDARVKRFNETFLQMHKYGWKKDSSYYPAAAVVSLMPGTVEENVQLLDDVTERLNKDKFSDVTNKALPMIGGGYKQLFAADPASFIGSDDYSHHSYYSGSDDSGSGPGFNLAWAFAGDLIDDGDLNLSGGFFGGGLLGGLMD